MRVIENNTNTAYMSVCTKSGHAGVVSPSVRGWGLVVLHGPPIHPDAICQYRSHVWLPFFGRLVAFGPVGMIGVVHIKVVPAIKPITAIHPLPAVNGFHIVPTFPA